MNEAFLVRLQRDGQPWLIEAFTSEGIVLGNERDSFPRAVRLEFDARSDVTAYRLNRTRQLNGWNPAVFNLNCTLKEGALLFTGADPMALPAGNYWLRVVVDDLTGPSRRLSLDIAENQADALVDVPVQPDPRRVVLTTPFAEFDPAILMVLQAAGTSIDGLSIEPWLASSDPRSSRKACLLNLMAKLRTVPAPKAPLIGTVVRVIFIGTERVYAEVQRDLFTRLQALAADPEKPFYYEGTPKSAMHLRLLQRVEALGLGAAARFDLHSFRQEGRLSMQAVVAVPKDANGRHFADFDIDLGNPLEDVEGFFIHMGELASGAPTDHLDLRAKLAKGTLKEFLYYRVVSSA